MLYGRAIYLLVMCLISGFVLASNVAFAEGVSIVERPDNEFLILAIDINDNLRSDGIEAYLPEQSGPEKLLVPLGALSNALSFSISVQPADGNAKGWFIKENNQFQISLEDKNIFITGKKVKFPDDGIEAHIDDIYVSIEILEEWFDLSINLDMSDLILEVDYEGDLPFEEEQLRRERSKDFGRPRVKSGRVVDSKNITLMPYKKISLPSLVLSQSISYNHSPVQKSYSGNVSVQGNMDMLGFGSNFVFQGEFSDEDTLKLTTSNLTLKRSDGNNELLGILKAGRIEVGDVNYPSVPLYSGKSRGRGVYVSSDSQLGLEIAFEEDGFKLDGEAPIGWDAELYRNGNYVGFQEISSEGRYDFIDIELSNGYNLFEIVLYGPEGQKEIIKRKVLQNRNMLKKGQVKYEFAAGQPDSSFLPLVDGAENSDDVGASARILYGINKNITIGATGYYGPEDIVDSIEQRMNRAVALTLMSSYLGMNSQINLLKAGFGRTSAEILTSTKVMGANISVRHVIHRGYDLLEKETKSSSDLIISRNFKLVNVSVGALMDKFYNKDRIITVNNTISSSFMGLKFTNNLEKTFDRTSFENSLDGNFSVVASLFNTRIRSNLSYDLGSDAEKKLDTLAVSGQKKINDTSSLKFSGAYTFLSKTSSLNLKLSKNFDPLAVDFVLGGDSEQNYSMGLALRTALQADYNGKYGLIDSEKGSQAAMGIRAFLDNDSNDVFSNGDEVIENIIFEASRGGGKGTTNNEGVAWLEGLPETPMSIYVRADTIPSIYLYPSKKNLDVFPRRGNSDLVDFPFIQLGEIDGFIAKKRVNEDDNNEYLVAIQVYLIDAETGKEVGAVASEYDGYFVFSSLPMGKYIVAASDGWFDLNDEQYTVSYPVEITNKEPAKFDMVVYVPIEEEIVVEEVTEPQYLLHLGSFRGNKSANKEIDRIKDRYKEVLHEIEIGTINVDIGKRKYIRIMGGPVVIDIAKNICANLSKKNFPGGCNIIAQPLEP